MVYSFDKDKTGYFLKIEGDLDLYSSYNLKEDIKAIFLKEPENILIDLSHLNYIDSAGIGFLIDLKKNATQNNKLCDFKNIPPDILKLFHSIRVDVILQIK
jgi:anti-sigma B factor antagonist